MPTSSRPLERGSGLLPGPRFFFSLMVLFAVGCTVEPRPLPDDGLDASTPTLRGVEAMLQASASSWNAGDLDGFVDDYSDDPDLAFVGSAGVTRGIDAVRAVYEAGYWSTGGPPDSLRFEDVEVTPLGDRHALALGRYVLYRPGAGNGAGDDAQADDAQGDDTRADDAPGDDTRADDAPGDSITSTGWFTLVLGLEEGRWRILHDHSSELDAG